jgi:hypothetical protein
VELQRSHLVSFVSDEGGSLECRQERPVESRQELRREALDVTLEQLAARLVRLSGSGYIKPRTFLGVAGMKVFRDDIWSHLRVVFRADHKAYKRLGYYDFPQHRIARRILIGLAWLVTGLPLIRSRFPSMIRGQMILPMRKAALRGRPARQPA